MIAEIDIIRIAAEAGRNHKTVRAWARGARVTPQTRHACEAAAERLGIDVEPMPEAHR